jgi:hypothetical protein
MQKAAFCMAEYDDKLSVTLPESLRRQFDQVRRRLWRVETTVAACAVTGGILASFLALFVSDRFWDTPVWLRAALLLVGLAAAIAAALAWMRRWIWRRRDLRDLANLVQKKYRRLGDRLLGVVELSNEERHYANFSPALYHAAIHQVADQAKGFDFAQSVSVAAARNAAFGAAGLAACLLLIFGLLPRPGWNTLLRWAMPAADISRYTLVAVDGLPAELIVAHGEPFALAAHVRYRSFWKPQHGLAIWPRQQPVQGAVQQGTLRLQIPGQVENGVLEVRVGDARAAVKVRPTYRPTLQELAARIELPGYLRYPEQNQLLQDGALVTVEGSQVAFHGKVSRSLSSARMQTGEGQPAPLQIDGDKFSSGPTRPDGASEFTFNWQDTLGLSNSAPLRLSVQTQPDAPPVPEIPDLPRDIAVLNSDVLSIRVRARDDFGVRDFGLTWEVTADSPRTSVATTDVKTQTASTRVKTVEKAFLWSPAVFGIPADSTVELAGYARDYLPDRPRSRTAAYHLRVLSPEEHAEMLRLQLEAVMAQVEEVTRLQEKIVAALGEVKDTEKMADAQKSARLGQSKDDQLQNAANLDDLSKQGEQVVREAMKNPLMNEETIRKWSQSMQQWRQLSAQKMPEAAGAMEAARQNSAAQPQQTAEAMQKAEDILDELEKMEQKANQHLDDLQALTLAQRLRKVGGQERDIGLQLFDSASNTIGLLPRDLPEKFKLFERELTRGQAGAQMETVNLQAEISRFFERTQKPAYGQVSQEMKETRAPDELDRLGGLIGNNIGLEASENLAQWSERFQKWSEKLEPKSSGSGSGSGSGQQSLDLTAQLIALLRLREGEMNLRDQTTLLDQDKGPPESYHQRAAALADGQEKLAGDLEGIHRKVPVPEIDPAFADVSGAMKEVLVQLQKPQTGQPADEAEVKSVESLTDLINLINEQAQRPSQQPSPGKSGDTAEEMQFLLQMMRDSANAKAFAAKPASGLNRSGGTASRPGGPLSGDAAGQGAGRRAVGQAAGVIETAPAEFRDALENYYHGLENSKE